MKTTRTTGLDRVLGVEAIALVRSLTKTSCEIPNTEKRERSFFSDFFKVRMRDPVLHAVVSYFDLVNQDSPCSKMFGKNYY